MQRTVLSEFGWNNIYGVQIMSWRYSVYPGIGYSKQNTTSEAFVFDESARDQFDIDKNLVCWGVGWGVLTGLLVPVAFRNKCERATGPKPEPFQSIFPGVNATRTSGTGLERGRNANRNRCERGLRTKNK